MSKRIALNFFRALSFDVVVRQAPSRAMHSPPPTPEHRPALPPDGGLPVVGRWLVDSAKSDCAKTTGHFPNRSHPFVNGRERAEWLTSTSSAR